MLYHLASHFGERESEESEYEETENEGKERVTKGDESESEPLINRTCSTKSRCHASSFIL